MVKTEAEEYLALRREIEKISKQLEKLNEKLEKIIKIGKDYAGAWFGFMKDKKFNV